MVIENMPSTNISTGLTQNYSGINPSPNKTNNRVKFLLASLTLILIAIAAQYLPKITLDFRSKAAVVYPQYSHPSQVYVSHSPETKTNLIDSNETTIWSSGTLQQSTDIVWVTVDLGYPTHVARIDIVPVTKNGQTVAFPENFNLSAKNEGEDQKIIPGYDFIGYPNPNGTLSFHVNQTYRYFGFGSTKTRKDEDGNWKVKIAEIRIITNECGDNSQCNSDEVCQNNTCGLNMNSYWNLKGGNYWIFDGQDKYGGSLYSFRERYDSEIGTILCPNNNGKSINNVSVQPWRFTRKEDCPSPHLCYWGNMRFLISDPTDDSQWPYVWSAVDKRYNRTPQNPYAAAGNFIEHTLLLTNIQGSYRATPPYLYTPKLLSDFEQNIAYRYQHTTCSKNVNPSQPENTLNNICAQEPCPAGYYSADPFLIMRFRKTSVQTPAYSGSAVVISQGEHHAGGWCTREDWYIAPNIGLVRVDQWSCNKPKGDYCTNPQGQGCYCSDSGWFNNPSDHDNCYRNLQLVNAPMIMTLKKYYKGNALEIRANGQLSVTVPKGASLTMSFTDPSTRFTYEGQIEMKIESGNTFFSANGNTKYSGPLTTQWSPFNAGSGPNFVGENGQVTLTLSQTLPDGVYKARFRPLPPYAPPDALQSGSETIREFNTLPWSNVVTVQIGNPSPTPTAIPIPTSIPSISPTLKKPCDAVCVQSSECINPLICYPFATRGLIIQACRNPSCPTDADCACNPTNTPTPAPSATPTRQPTPVSCDNTCTLGGHDCTSPLVCYRSGTFVISCRNPSCPYKTNCLCN